MFFWQFISNRVSKNSNAQSVLEVKKHTAIKNKLISSLDFDFDSYSNSQQNEIVERPAIWYFWWDGKDNLPDVCLHCLKSIEMNCCERKVIFVDKNNYRDFVKIHPVIEKKFKEGIIPIQQFSDVLRVELLKTYGGLWLDATMFITSDLETELNSRFFTLKHGAQTRFVSNGRWSISCIGAEKAHPLFMFLSDAFKRYYSKYDSLVDYFLMDYLVDIAYENISSVSIDIDSVAQNNPDIYFLQNNFDKKFDSVEFDKITLDTKFFKLNWRDKCSFCTDGDESYSSKIFKLYI
ncbi:polysaccharide biosynthesis protein [Alteromonas sp. KUL17]|nr:polysaccharide biosynthesis protein [Alteromonas sp. KUL17]